MASFREFMAQRQAPRSWLAHLDGEAPDLTPEPPEVMRVAANTGEQKEAASGEEQQLLGLVAQHAGRLAGLAPESNAKQSPLRTFWLMASPGPPTAPPRRAISCNLPTSNRTSGLQQLRDVGGAIDTVWLSASGDIRTSDPEQPSAAARPRGRAIVL